MAEKEMTCKDCNWFSTRESYCSKKKKEVNPNDEVCDEKWIIVRPVTEESYEEIKEEVCEGIEEDIRKKIEEDMLEKICSDCLEKGHSILDEFKYCPSCGKELESNNAKKTD